MIRAPGLGEKEPPVEKGDTVRVKLDDDTWLLLEVSGVERDTLYIRVSSGFRVFRRSASFHNYIRLHKIKIFDFC